MHGRRSSIAALAAATLLPLSGEVFAADSLTVGELVVDPPTLHTVGVQLLISDDDDRDATVTVRYRPEGETAWRTGFPLLRVWPETVAVSVPAQFAGSLFDLTPGTSYEIELTATDPDGGDEIVTITAATRPLPAFEPASPVAVTVTDAAELAEALAGANAGHVITLAEGTYPGTFSIGASGTADNPIVIRGASATGTILDGQSCSGCNILEVAGSHVHIERMTLAHGERALRFFGATTGNVARQLRIDDVRHGIASQPDQRDFFVCDNTIQGRLAWPWTFEGDASTHWDDRGVEVTGDGHVVCHNEIRGFGDPIVNKKSQHRSWDVHGNDVYDSFDGTELDDGEGNTRLWGNRYTNVMAPVSIQPIWGGPTYVLRNVVFNAPDEPIKLKSTGGEPSGALIFHNTFVSPDLALNLQTPITQHNFRIENNLFVGPEQLAGNRTVDWTAVLNGGIFDFNGYFPDGGMWFGNVGGVNQVYDSFAEAQASGAVEANGVLLARPIFASDFIGPADGTVEQTPPDFALAPASEAVDAGGPLPGINTGHIGAGPDLGAVELGCPAPHYGPRAEGDEAATNAVDCREGGGGVGGTPGVGGAGAGGEDASSGAGGSGVGAGAGTDDAAAIPEEDAGGCGCRVTGGSRGSWLAGALLLGLASLRRRSRAAPRPTG